MTPEAQRIAIAEACGWTELDFPYGRDKERCPKLEAASGGRWRTQIPNYLNDLNAMHEAEKIILEGSDEQWKRYNALLAMIVFPVWHAEAKHRAEAFLRTIGKWEEAE